MKITTQILPRPSKFTRMKDDGLNARKMVRASLREFKLQSGKCSECGNGNVVAHHEDYSKPLEIVWLCKSHHSERHHELGWGNPKDGKALVNK